jgi:hypothetical protein
METLEVLKTQYIGVVTRSGAVVDVMLFGNKEECIDNLTDAVYEDFNPKTDTAQIFEHTDFTNGDQNLSEVFKFCL